MQHTFLHCRTHKNEKAATIAMSIKQVIQMYLSRGFIIKHIHGDGQSEHIRKLCADADIHINITGQNNMCLASKN